MATERRLIDANELLRDIHYFDEQNKNDVWLTLDIECLIKDQPTVDAVEVVRCKNCDWYRKHENSICVNPKCGKSWYGCPVPPMHFCSYGERRTDNG